MFKNMLLNLTTFLELAEMPEEEARKSVQYLI